MDGVMGYMAEVARQTWAVTVQMAPYLLFGFLVAGAMSVVLSPAWVERHLGARHKGSAVKAALFGVPLPLCSCGVIPVAASLRRHGASRGAVAAFLMSTPQTGVDSLLVTYGLLGPVFALVRPIMAFFSGAACGWAVDRFVPDPAEAAPEAAPPAATVKRFWVVRMLRHGFVTLAGDVHKAMLLGILISGLMGALLPPDILKDYLGTGWLSMLAMMAVGIPLYVCSTASVPIALGLLHAGISPGAVLVFLITGPATNAATIAVLFRVLGRQTAWIYLATLAATALLAGLFFDGVLVPQFGAALPHVHAEAASLLEQAVAVLLLGVLLAPFFRGRGGAIGWLRPFRPRRHAVP